MGKTFKFLGIITLVVIIGFGVTACSDPGSGPSGGIDINEAFTISGSFETQNEGATDAKFFAKSTVTPTLSWSRNARAGELVEVALEGLLEDGDITFKLKGSYNSETKLYMLSAASSFLRYSISGDTSKPDSSEAVVQVREGNSWTSIKISVSASVDGTPPSIDGSGNVADELAKGIPEEMWGVWWGLDSLEKSKGDIVQPGNYYYMLDAYTIKQYVNRYSIWNLEGYTCFFEGATVENSVAKGRVEFNYTDQNAIDNSADDAIVNWWINHLIAYANSKWGSVPGGTSGDSARIAEVKDNANQGWLLWGDPSWTAVLDRYKAPAQGDDGPLGTNQVWNNLFGPGTGFSYTAYRNDAYRIQNRQLQFGTYYAANGVDYFSDDPSGITNYNNLKWGASHSREKSDAASALPSSQIVTGTSGVFTIPSEVTAIKHNNFEGKTDVLQIISGAHWSVLDYHFTPFDAAKKLTFNVSMDVWLKNDARVAWQINQGAYKTQPSYPVVVGSQIASNPATVYEAGKWHKIQVTGLELVVSSGRVLYLSTMQFLASSTNINDPTSLIENEIYIANATIGVTYGDDVAQDPPLDIDGNLGNYAYAGIYENDEIVGYEYNRAVWGLSGENLAMAQADDSVLELVFTEPLTSLNIVWGASVNGWWSLSPLLTGDVTEEGVTYNSATGKLTIELPKVLANFELFKTAEYANLIILNWSVFNINDLGMTSAELTGTLPAEIVVGNYPAYAWVNGPYTSSVAFQIVNLTNEHKYDVMKVVNPTTSSAAQYDLADWKGQEITVTFSANVKRVGAAGDLVWQINNSSYPTVGSRITNAAADTWHEMSGTWTGTPTAEYPSLYLSTHENNSATTTYYIADFYVEVVPAVGDGTINNPHFTGWGGLDGSSNAFTLAYNAEHNPRATYTFPTTENNKFEITFDVELVAPVNADRPAKLVFDDRAKDTWSDTGITRFVVDGGTETYPQYETDTSDITFTGTIPASGFLTFRLNTWVDTEGGQTAETHGSTSAKVTIKSIRLFTE